MKMQITNFLCNQIGNAKNQHDKLILEV